ncbi:MAG: DUF2442 domain-containing protein [Symploca sp. SIO2C1]|nr:DUF2442 domain-containing protein [Symploca sp. SIO2C1]
MNISALDCSYKVVDILLTPETFEVILDDGTIIPTSRSRFPRLAQATDEQLAKWEVDKLGIGIHWEELDEDITIYGLIKEAKQAQLIRYKKS